MANIQGDFVCGNGHARSNPDSMFCEVCGGALKPDETRGDVTPAELGIQNPTQSVFGGTSSRPRLL